MSAGGRIGVVAGRRFGVELRAAQATDAPELARLLAQSGVRLDPADAASRLATFRGRGAVLVATGYEGLSGLAAVGWSPSLLHDRLVAQLSTLVVAVDERRHGIGRMLLKAASQAARAAGCNVLTCAAAEGQTDWAAFCRATGFSNSGEAFVRSLRRQGETPG